MNAINEVRRIDVKKRIADMADLPPEAIAAKTLHDKKMTKNTPPVIDPEALKNLVAETVKSALAEQQSSHAQAIADIEAKRQAEVEALAAKHAQDLADIEAKKTATESEIASLKDAMAIKEAELREQAQREIESVKTALTKELKVKESQLEKAADVFKLQGVTSEKGVMFNTTIGAKSDKPEGALREFFEVESLAAKKTTYSQKAGDRITTRDNRELNSFAVANRAALLKDLESYGKENGLFQSNKAMTSGAGIPEGFLVALSALMRTNNRSRKVFWQFPTYQFNFAKSEGDKLDIPRSPFIAPITSSDDRLLSGNGSFVDIDPGNQGITTGSARCTLEEWGLGKNAQNQPIGIPTFTEAYSIVNLMDILRRNLLEDYYRWEDLKIRELYDPTSRIVYNDGGQVTPTPGDVGSGNGGNATEAFANYLFAYMDGLEIPSLPDGNFIWVMPPASIASLKASLGTRAQAATPEQLTMLSEILLPDGMGETDRVTGYVGNYCGFHVFSSNAFGVGAAGSAGVQNTTLGVGSTLTRDSYVFGAETTGRGIGSEFEIVPSNVVPFGRAERYIWRSEEGFVAMDVDPTGYNDTSAVPQQLRVIKARLTDVAV